MSPANSTNQSRFSDLTDVPDCNGHPVSPGLSGLSDRELLLRLKELTRTERSTTLTILLHLGEVERRDLHVSLGFHSLFDYAIDHLRYSRSAAGRRVQVARCIRRFPEVYGLLEHHEVNLTTACLVAPVLSADNKTRLLEKIRNKSQREVEEIVAPYRPPAAVRDRVRPVCVPVPDHQAMTLIQTSMSEKSRSGSEKSPNSIAATIADLSESAPPPDESSVEGDAAFRRATEPAEPRTEKKLLIQFVARPSFMTKCETARALLSNRRVRLSFEQVFEAGLDAFLERNDPERRAQRRAQRREKLRERCSEKHRETSSEKLLDTRRGKGTEKRNRARDTPREKLTQKNPGNERHRSRHIPTAVRDDVYLRDGGRCTYVGPTGIRCGATYGLEIDHIMPFARGGIHAASNLRLRCAPHNRLEAERVYGADFMKRFRRQQE